MSYQLKLLSGTLNGVEYTLNAGDTLFHIGSQQDLLDGRAAHLLQGASNAYFLPEDLPPGAFVVQWQDGEEGRAALQLGERETPDQPWQYRPLLPQTVFCSGGVYFAVRAEADAWAPEVLAFTPPGLPVAAVVPGRRAASDESRRRPRRRLLRWAGLAMVGVALASACFYWQYTPQVRVSGLASVLRDAPADYQIVAGSDGRLYAFTDDRDGPAWGERASRRLQRHDDVYLLRRNEATRLEQGLLQAGLPVVIVRLVQPTRPDIVLLGPVSTAQRERAQAFIGQQAPYASVPAQVSTTTDAALVALAQAQLRGLGISSRAEPHGARVSVINDVFLDDAALNAMAGMAERFHREWGQRRITVHLQLWDDLLQGRSYRYSPGQLMSVGEGRWTYARATHGAPPAAP
ncbi:PrgH/EprH family type III secretion apparatus protein [Stenotrophomonas sp. NPDC077659]|uniref:PrgH/EprH family type III secretion apparatus protein n=1 Tax=Stenotrophomonas sp. NPDC077659 TaxID=3390694 RepID=UPI003D00F5B8